MNEADGRRERLETLLTLACEARGWTRSRLAEELERDVSHLVPGSGDPKLSFVMKLAKFLQWPVGDIAELLWGAPAALAGATKADLAALSARQLHDYAKSRFDAGDFFETIRAMSVLHDAPGSGPELKAHARAFEAAAWIAMGRFADATEAATRGLQFNGLRLHTRLALKTNQADALLHTWKVHLSHGIATSLVDECDSIAAPSVPIQKRLGHALYVRGVSSLRLAGLESETRDRRLVQCDADLRRSIVVLEPIAVSAEPDHHHLHGTVIVCRAAILEAAVERGEISPAEALRQVEDAVSVASDLSSLNSLMLLGYGWWCITGCTVAVRHLAGRELQRILGVLAVKALDIASQTNNWVLRERALALQWLGHEALEIGRAHV